MSEQEQAAADDSATQAADPPTELPDQPAPPDDEAALEASLAEQTIDVPDSTAQDGKVKLVPLSAVTSVRKALQDTKAELATAREGTAKAQQLEARVAQLEGHLQQVGPKAQAYDAAVASQQQQAPPEDTTELQEIARDLDLYTTDGKPDLERARRISDREQRVAQRAAQSAVAPLAQHTIRQQSQIMLTRAKATTLPNGAKPDPATLEAIWGRLDPSLTATKEGAQHAYIQALGVSSASVTAAATDPGATRGADGKFLKADTIPPPLHTERAGGKETSSVALSDHEKKYIKAAGMTEAEYLKTSQSAPWLRR